VKQVFLYGWCFTEFHASTVPGQMADALSGMEQSWSKEVMKGMEEWCEFNSSTPGVEYSVSF